MRRIKLFATLRDLVGSAAIDVPFEEGTITDLIACIRDRYPVLAAQIVDGQGELTGLVHIFVEGRNIDWLQGMDTHVRVSDDLFLIPPVAGG